MKLSLIIVGSILATTTLASFDNIDGSLESKNLALRKVLSQTSDSKTTPKSKFLSQTTKAGGDYECDHSLNPSLVFLAACNDFLGKLSFKYEDPKPWFGSYRFGSALPGTVYRRSENEIIVRFTSNTNLKGAPGYWKVDKTKDENLKKGKSKVDWYCSLDYISIHRGAKYL